MLNLSQMKWDLVLVFLQKINIVIQSGGKFGWKGHQVHPIA